MDTLTLFQRALTIPNGYELHIRRESIYDRENVNIAE